jgi:hypothetical protein
MLVGGRVLLLDDGFEPGGAVPRRDPRKWKSATTESNVIFISPLAVNKNGMSDIYLGKLQAAYFDRSLAGYPGAFTEIQDGHAGGYCALWVGVTDGLQS